MLTTSEFKPAFWLRGPHVQTLFAYQARPMPRVDTETERLELEDGDFLDLDWLITHELPVDAPLVLVLHGLGGSLKSKYARGLLQQVAAHGGRGVLLNFRGASKPNRLARSYHSGETDDLARVLQLLEKRYPRAPLAAAGYSLGANVLLKYLGEQGRQSPLTCAVAVSVPFDLKVCAYAVQKGFARVYQNRLLDDLRRIVTTKVEEGIIEHPLPKLNKLQDFPSFDAVVTAPLNGFADAHDYYERASCRPYLAHVHTPTLILHARDDPFMAPGVVPRDDELSPWIRLELSEHGGHVGFVASEGRRRKPIYWLEQRIPAYFRQWLPDFAPLPEAATDAASDGYVEAPNE